MRQSANVVPYPAQTRASSGGRRPTVARSNGALGDQIKAALGDRRPRIGFAGWGERPTADLYDTRSVHLMGRYSERPIAVIPLRIAKSIFGERWMGGRNDLYLSDCHPRTLCRMELKGSEYLLLVFRYDVIGAVMFADGLLERLKLPSPSPKQQQR